MDARPPDPVKLFVAVLYNAKAPRELVARCLSEEYGPIDYVSKPVPFDITDYYEPEMGAPLLRVFYSFAELIDPIKLAEIKLHTNRLEREFEDGGKRLVNLDPGYMDTHKLVLASAKFGGPKIYIGHGIYADPTLFYSKGAFHPYEWGFPDFRAGLYNATLLEIRARFKMARRAIL